MRAYGTNPQIWGGDDSCGHEWGDEKIQKRSQNNSAAYGYQFGPKATDPNRQRIERPNPLSEMIDISQGSTCIHCGAWRGELGAEPQPEMFISHLCDIFDEVKRVLRLDGICWINIGDSYARQAGDDGNLSMTLRFRAAGLERHKQRTEIRTNVNPSTSVPIANAMHLTTSSVRLAPSAMLTHSKRRLNHAIDPASF